MVWGVNVGIYMESMECLGLNPLQNKVAPVLIVPPELWGPHRVEVPTHRRVATRPGADEVPGTAGSHWAGQTLLCREWVSR